MREKDGTLLDRSGKEWRSIVSRLKDYRTEWDRRGEERIGWDKNGIEFNCFEIKN